VTTRVVIFGAGGLGREVLQVVRDQQRVGVEIECLGFLVDAGLAGPTVVNGIMVSQDLAGFAADSSVQFVVAVGRPAARARIVRRIERAAGSRFATIVHPSSILGDTVSVGAGSIILPAACLTTDVRVGQHVLINPKVSIAHDCLLEDYVSLSPSVTLAGGVRLGQGCELGTGAIVLPRQQVDCWSIVGAGAVVITPVAANTTVVGVPARRVGIRPPGWQETD